MVEFHGGREVQTKIDEIADDACTTLVGVVFIYISVGYLKGGLSSGNLNVSSYVSACTIGRD